MGEHMNKLTERLNVSLKLIAEEIDEGLANDLARLLIQLINSIFDETDVRLVISLIAEAYRNYLETKFPSYQSKLGTQLSKSEKSTVSSVRAGPIELTHLEKVIINTVNTLGLTYAEELAKLIKRPRNLISSYCSRLKNKGLISSFKTGRYTLYSSKKCMLTNFLLTGAGKLGLNQLPEFRESFSEIQELQNEGIIKLVNNKIELIKIRPTLILMGWSDVLCMEYGTNRSRDEYFDEILCQKLTELAHHENPKMFPTRDAAEEKLKEKLNEYAIDGNKLWYDYYHLAKDVLYLEPEVVDKLHEEIYREYGGLNLIDGIRDVLKRLINSGYTVYIITNAVKGVLKKRLELTNLANLFHDDNLVTSDLEDIHDVTSREEHIKIALERTGVDPSEVLIVIDNAFKLLPARDILRGSRVMCYKHPRPYRYNPFGSPGIDISNIELPVATDIICYGTTSLSSALMNLLVL